MINSPENNKDLEQNSAGEVGYADVKNSTVEDSTIFSAPLEHKRKKVKTGTQKMIFSIVAITLSVAILATSIFLVRKYIKVKNTDAETPTQTVGNKTNVLTGETVSGSELQSLTTSQYIADISKVVVKNSNGEFTLLPIDYSGTTYWSVSGVDIAKTSSSEISSIVSSTQTLTSFRTVEKSMKDCGLEEPRTKVTIVKKDNTSKTILIGSKSTDNMGYYIMVEGEDEIHVVTETLLEPFEFDLLDLSDVTPIQKTLFDTDTSANQSDDGTYAYFDSLTLSGKLYPEKITIINNPGKTKTDEIVPYLLTTPIKRYANAEALAPLVNVFSQSTSVVGNCALDINDETLKQFGLDDPDVVLSMTINGETKTFKFSILTGEDEGYCAIVYDGANTIRKGSVSSFTFLSTSPETYNYKSMFMISILDLSSLTIKNQDKTLKFDITPTDGTENTNSPYIAKINGKDVSKGMIGYYSDFTCIQCSNFEITETSGEPETTITFTFSDGGETVVTLYNVNANEYQYSIDGTAMGRIPSSEHNKIIKNFETIASGELVK